MKEVGKRDWEVQRQVEECKIKEAKYNKKYKDLEPLLEGPRYLRKVCLDKGNTGDNVRALLRLRCGNMEDRNKYWLEDETKLCVFCGTGEDCINHYVKECDATKDWFSELGKNYKDIEERIWSDEIDNTKGRILRKLWEKEIIKNRKERL
ncbi:hypothetical protein RF55_2255 [Lasius niger]|uniref:Reverse transcriptase n=1 Tax=Lasius niger TaxID=67767 RepID=A0A0J7L3G1_LASNI|nr:hypothetical protein RF55_2255 [Lasius niger]